MASRVTLTETIESIYDAALDPNAWELALDRLRLFCNSWVAHLHLWDKQASRVPFSLLVGEANPEAEPLYVAYYGSIDPRVRKLGEMRPGELLVCYEHFDNDFVARSEFYQDYYLPKAQGRYVAGTKLVDDDGMSAVIGLHRDPANGFFSEGDKGRMRVVLPHLARATRVQQKLDSFMAERRLVASALDRLPFGLALVDARSALLLANAQAEALFRAKDHLCCLRGRVAAAAAAEDDQLQSAIRRGHGLVQMNRGTREPLSVLAVPITQENSTRFGQMRRTVLLLINDPETAPRPKLELIAGALGLTKAEARVAAAIAEGKSLEAIADEFGVSRNTIRNQTQAILGKTGFDRQVGLVRRVLSLPTARTDGQS